jgi:hypothetical protein
MQSIFPKLLQRDSKIGDVFTEDREREREREDFSCSLWKFRNVPQEYRLIVECLIEL